MFCEQLQQHMQIIPQRLFSLASGIFNNRLDSDTWHFMIIITSVKESDAQQSL